MSSNHNDTPHRLPASNPPELLDPVVEEALLREIVTPKQVADAWLKRKAMYYMGKHHPVWRWLAEQNGVDREEVIAIAARCYDYKPLEVPLDTLKNFVQRISPCFTEEQWKVMLRLRIIPVKRSAPRGISNMWNFAANDPTSKIFHTTVYQYVGNNYELFHTNRQLIASLFAERYLTQMELPRKRASGTENN